MPLFEFACQSCRHEFELLVRSSESPSCPKCGSDTLEQLLSVVAAHASSRRELPIAASPARGGGCGLPQCGGGHCGMS